MDALPPSNDDCDLMSKYQSRTRQPGTIRLSARKVLDF